MDFDIEIETLRAFIAALILLYLWRIGRRDQLQLQSGWHSIIGGFALILFASILDVTDNFPELNPYVIVGDTHTEAFLEKIIGYLGGFIFLFFGFIRWLPIIAQLRKVEATLQQQFSELKLAQLELVEKDVRHRVILEQSPIGMAFVRDGITVDVNQKCLKMFGYENAAEVCGLSLVNRIAPQFRADVADRIKRRMQGEEVESTYESVCLRKDGSEFPVLISATRMTFSEGPMTVAFITDLSVQKKVQSKIYSLEFFDALTQLPNRRLLIERLKASQLASARNRQYGAVLFVDMDNFKTLNDTLGHDYGDLLLVEVAERLQSCVREADTVARMGGDDFVVLLEAVDTDTEQSSQKVALIADKIRSTLATPFQLNDYTYTSSCSIGVSLYRDSVVTFSELLKHTDMAMYRAKESGRNAVRFFDAEMKLAVETRAGLEADLHRAVPERQLQLHYQIQVDSEHRPIGAEALVRWFHPTLGMVSPAQFIPLAEESSLILDVGGWVLEAACRQLAAWSKAEQTKYLTLAVNISAKQFIQPEFVGNVKNLIHVHELDASRLKIELTESVVLSDVTDVISKMHALKALRVTLAMDDFGTGYSSLSYLKLLPLDQLKIDQSFVRDITSDQNDQVMVQTIIDMAKNFHLNVIAEGVETEAQESLLKHFGCMAYQGYFFSRPVPIEQFEALLNKA